MINFHTKSVAPSHNIFSFFPVVPYMFR